MSQSPTVLKYTIEIPLQGHALDKETMDVVAGTINRVVSRIVNEILHDVLDKYESHKPVSNVVPKQKSKWFRFNGNQ